MSRSRKLQISGIFVGFALGVIATLMLSRSSNLSDANAAGGKVPSPTVAAPDRYVYYPGTEPLGPNEMRVVALGTGQPTVRPKQASACFLVELGNFFWHRFVCQERYRHAMIAT